MTQRNMPAVLTCFLCLFCLIPLLLAGCQQKAPVEQNAITSVVPDGKGSITIKAALTESFLESYLEKKVYLFELPSIYSAEVDLNELDPVAEIKAKGEMTTRIQAYDGVRSRLHSSFLLASYDRMEETYTVLTKPMAVTSFSDMTESPAKESGEISIKGLISDHPADAIRLGISHTVVDIHMERLILERWQEGAVSYVYNGVTAYLNAEELERLDETVRAYTDAGVHVYLRFLLGARQDDHATPAVLYDTLQDAENPAVYYAVNMGDARAAEIMEGFFDFMAERYAAGKDESAVVSDFILGYRVNHGAVYHASASESLDAYVANYEKLVRVANAAVKSHNARGRVFISLDSHRSVGEMTGGWDVPSFLSAFRDEAALRGDYDWNLACEMYANTVDIWTEQADIDANYYTVHSLKTLTDLLVSDQYRTPAGDERGILISQLTIPAVTKGGTPSEDNNKKQAASYAYAYMTCVQNGHVEALIYGAYADTAENADLESQCGLWTLTERGDHLAIAEKRPIYDLFQKMDTRDAATLSTDLTAIMDEPFTKLERALAGKEQPVQVLHGTAVLEAFEPNHLKAASLFAFDQGTCHGWTDAGELTYMELVKTEVLDTVTFYSRFDRSAVCDPMGLTVTVSAAELMGGESIILDLYGGAVPGAGSGQAKPTVTLRMTCPATGSVAEGGGAVVYEASVSEISSGVWQTVVFDVEEFTSLLELSDEVTLTLSMDYDPALHILGAHHMGIAGMYITGHTATTRMSPGLIIGIITALALIVVGVFLFLFLRHRKRR